MNRFKKQVIVAAALVLLFVIGTLVNSSKVAAQGPPGGLAVNIVNPLPVPVTGSTTVSGTIAAKVTNTPTTAVPTVAAPAASQLYQSRCSAIYPFNNSIVACNFAPVPAGQTLFIETESIFSQSDPGADPILGGINVTSGFVVFIPMVQQAPEQAPGPLADLYTGALAGRIWVKAGDTPGCQVNLSKISISGEITCVISGYLAPAE